jgi:hypothetical protein
MVLEPDTLKLCRLSLELEESHRVLAAIQFLVFKDVGDPCSQCVDITNWNWGSAPTSVI